MNTDNEGWITHDGGEMPVERTHPVEFNDGDYVKCGFAGFFEWDQTCKYRLLVPKHELEVAQARIAELEAELAQRQKWEDKPDELSEAIDACHPMKTKTHDLYAKAHELVSNRHSKGALVGLVHYLLCKESAAHQEGYNEGVEAAWSLIAGMAQQKDRCSKTDWEKMQGASLAVAANAIRALKKEGE